MNKTNRSPNALALAGFITGLIGAPILLAQETLPNACPVDGCEVKIVSVKPSSDELEVNFSANFTPDVAKNHFHVWWGELYTVEQVGRSAQSEHGVQQGKWHRHDDYPTYITTGAASSALANTPCENPFVSQPMSGRQAVDPRGWTVTGPR
ncbi:MAG TPA: hypothetical protein EYH03_01375 [Chromatiales bacterium]|nr:hypothetical protein [Chromatiales bacterium]